MPEAQAAAPAAAPAVPDVPATTGEAATTPDAPAPKWEEVAAKEARKAADAEASKPRDVPGGDPANDPSPANDNAAKPEPTALQRLEAKMRTRVDSQKARERLRAEVAAEVQREYEAKHAGAIAEARAAAHREMIEQLRTKPDEFVKGAGVDPKDMIADWVKASDPQAALARKIAELEAKVGQAPKELTEKLQALEAMEAQRQEAFRKAQAESGFTQLLSQCTDEKTPYLRAIFSDAQIKARAQDVANQYCKATGETICPFGELVEYLESEAKRELQQFAPKLSRLQELATPAVKPTESGNGSSTKPRTLSASSTSERRASPKPASEMTEAEAREAMLAAARSARTK